MNAFPALVAFAALAQCASAAQDGDLLIPAGDAGTAGFYRIVVGDRAPQN